MVRYFWSTNPILLRDLARRREDALGADLRAPVCGNRSPSTRGHPSPPGLRAVARAWIHHAVWLYLRSTLSYRDVDDLLAERGLDICDETVRSWVPKCGPVIPRRLRRRRLRPATDGIWTRWCSDPGERMYLWRVVDHEGKVLDMLVQRRCDTRAALRLMRKLPKKARLRAEVAGNRQATLLRRGVPASTPHLPT
jgi:DDE domain